MARQRRGGGRAQYQGDIDPEDIFNMFFGMQPARGRTYAYQQQHGQQRRQQQQQYRTEGNANYAQLLQLMPLLLLFLFSFLGNQAGRNDLPFRLQRTPPEFTFRRETANSGTPYYVKGDFDQLYNNRNKVRSQMCCNVASVPVPGGLCEADCVMLALCARSSESCRCNRWRERWTSTTSTI